MLVYSIAGVLFGLAVLLLLKFCQSKKLSMGRFIGSYALMILGTLSIVFSIDWAYASVIEGEPQSAAIGFLVFGGIGIVLSLIGFRVATYKPKPKLEADTKASSPCA